MPPLFLAILLFRFAIVVVLNAEAICAKHEICPMTMKQFKNKCKMKEIYYEL